MPSRHYRSMRSSHLGLRLAPLLLAACAPAPPPCAECTLSNANNYSWSADLDVAVAPVASETDVRISWSTLSRDLQGHPVDPADDVATASLIAFRDLAPAEVAEGLATESLFQADVTLFATCEAADSACALSDFGVMGSSVDVPAYTEEGAATWLVALRRQDEAGAVSLLFLDPHDDASATAARIDDDASRLAADVDLQSLTPVPALAGASGVVLDWSAVTTDGLGHDAIPELVDRAYLARFDSPLADLEDEAFDLFLAGEALWTADLTGESHIALAEMSGATPFPGLDAGGTWLFALGCSTCTTPAPRFVTVLEATPG